MGQGCCEDTGGRRCVWAPRGGGPFSNPASPGDLGVSTEGAWTAVGQVTCSRVPYVKKAT